MSLASPGIILLMGVSGCGKTEVGRRLADRLNASFLDADDLHPESNVRKMAAGTPLSDDDRWPWLEAVAARLRGGSTTGWQVVGCSALKRSYRDRLRQASPDLRLVLLQGDDATIRGRLEGRTGHFMPAALLASQLATLEPPTADEQPLVVDVAPPVDQVVASILAWLAGMPAARGCPCPAFEPALREGLPVPRKPASAVNRSQDDAAQPASE
jgi:beta-N-acetylhexosaminidase